MAKNIFPHTQTKYHKQMDPPIFLSFLKNPHVLEFKVHRMIVTWSYKKKRNWIKANGIEIMNKLAKC